MSNTSRKRDKTDLPASPPLSAGTSRRESLGRMLRSLIPAADGVASKSMREARDVVAHCRALLSERGEVSGARLANDVVQTYKSLDAPAREAFFDFLATEFSLNPDVVGRAANTYQAEPSEANLVRLQNAVEPPRLELFRRINLAQGGTTGLVDMRRRLLETLDEHPERIGVDADLLQLFRSWFNRGFLSLQRIEWRTSALVLERLIQYEAVHQIQGWRDLRRRLEDDRRCYAFFHPALPEEPLIFIEVALVRRMPAKVQPLLDPEAAVVDPTSADSAVFYSITNCQVGLRGVSFGNFLIKQVVEELGREFPQLRTFATLSPVPGFAAWLANQGEPLTVDGRRTTMHTIIDAIGLRQLHQPPVQAAIQKKLTRLCAQYLLQAKRGPHPADPVARFHLANGARLERLNWMGDISPAGLKRSLGFTVNYVYRLADLESNHEAYAKAFAVSASREMQWLGKPDGSAKAPGDTAEPPARASGDTPIV